MNINISVPLANASRQTTSKALPEGIMARARSNGRHGHLCAAKVKDNLGARPLASTIPEQGGSWVGQILSSNS